MLVSFIVSGIFYLNNLCVFTEKPYSKPLERNVFYIPIITIIMIIIIIEPPDVSDVKINHGSRQSGPGCSKLTTSLVNETLKFQTLISQTCQYFLMKKCEKLLQCKSFSHFFNKKYQCIWL